MADFRRWFTVLAVLALVACAANAQIGTANGSATSGLACNATAGGTPQLRPEGYTELVGDIYITCTGGRDLPIGSAVPTTNITVYITPNVPITSRFMSSNGASEALLIIDDAGAGLPTGATGSYGPNATQTLCTSAQQQASGGSSCQPYVGLDNSGQYEVSVTSSTALTAGAGTNAQNVYQGKVGDFGSNTVTFYAVPVLPPATNGVSRTLRITNIRIPATGLAGTIQAFLSTGTAQNLPISGQAINIGIVGPSSSAAVKPNSSPYQQCTPNVGGSKGGSPALAGSLVFTEGFATAFKTRVVPGGSANGTSATTNILNAAEQTNTGGTGFSQNIPGGLYGGFASNSESGFILPTLSTSNTGTNAIQYTAGLADYGTRLKAVFYNIPAGLTLYVSTTSSAQTASSFLQGGTSVLPFAVLVATNSGEATPDGSGFGGGTSGVPITSSVAGSDGLSAFALSADSTGKAVAVWEVTNANPSATDVMKFSYYVAYNATSASTTYPYGTPITDLPLNAPVPDVQLSLAPEPGGGTFTTANATAGAIPIPRFAVVKTQEGRWLTINLCQTTLLYPFVTGAAGFDTGIAVANTSMDPFSTVNQTGSCKLYAYGVTVGTSGNTTFQTSLAGCDSTATPLPGTNCFPLVPAGQVMSVMASTALANFQGYVIAVCNFQYAHGYAAVTDLGLRNLWSSYLALELAPNSFGTATRGTSIEALIH